MLILEISCYYHNSAACLLEDGDVVAVVGAENIESDVKSTIIEHSFLSRSELRKVLGKKRSLQEVISSTPERLFTLSQVLGSMVGVSIRKPDDEEDMGDFVELMNTSFDLRDRVSVLPKHVFISLGNTGCLLGAYAEDNLVGFICWWPDPTSKESIYSHAIAVDRDHRGRGIGEKLLFAMQSSAEEYGYRTVWGTFDPLKSYLARLYLGGFGVTVSEYQNDYYGSLGAEELSGETPTDRFIATKDFQSESTRIQPATNVNRVLCVGDDGISLDIDRSEITPTGVNEGGREWGIKQDISEEVLYVEIPRDFTEIRDRGEADWRYATRKVFTELLKKNRGDYMITDFLHRDDEDIDECIYVLVKER